MSFPRSVSQLQWKKNNSLNTQKQCFTMRASNTFMLVSDLDDTMTGRKIWDHHTLKFSQTWKQFREQMHATSGMRRHLVYNTGRTKMLYDRLWLEKGHVMTHPDVLICGVGTQILHSDSSCDNGWREDTSWAEYISDSWDAQVVIQVLREQTQEHGEDRVKLLPEEVTSHKVTFQTQWAIESAVTSALLQSLSAAGVAVRLVKNGINPDWCIVDVLPARAGKANAAAAVAQLLGHQPANVITCGDGPNDLDMLQLFLNAIVVANATPPLQAWVKSSWRSENGSCNGGIHEDAPAQLLALPDPKELPQHQLAEHVGNKEPALHPWLAQIADPLYQGDDLLVRSEGSRASSSTVYRYHFVDDANGVCSYEAEQDLNGATAATVITNDNDLSSSTSGPHLENKTRIGQSAGVNLKSSRSNVCWAGRSRKVLFTSQGEGICGGLNAAQISVSGSAISETAGDHLSTTPIRDGGEEARLQRVVFTQSPIAGGILEGLCTLGFVEAEEIVGEPSRRGLVAEQVV